MCMIILRTYKQTSGLYEHLHPRSKTQAIRSSGMSANAPWAVRDIAVGGAAAGDQRADPHAGPPRQSHPRRRPGQTAAIGAVTLEASGRVWEFPAIREVGWVDEGMATLRPSWRRSGELEGIG